MSADIEAYLSSDEAVADVAAQMERGRTDCDRWTIGVNGSWKAACCHGQRKLVGSISGVAFIYESVPGEPEAWYSTKAGITVYYRPDGDRYIVTDLGEAVRALRLRSGRLDIWWSDLDFVMPVGVYGDEAGYLLAMSEAEYNVSAADLPRAICAVMLAAWRVSRLEVRP